MKTFLLTSALMAAAVSAVSAAKCTDEENALILGLFSAAEEDYSSVCDWNKDLCDQSDDCLAWAFWIASFIPDCEAADGINYGAAANDALDDCYVDWYDQNPSYTDNHWYNPYNWTTPSVYEPKHKCWAVSVEHDATYCIDGPICSGSGDHPAGTKCPKKGDVAIADCVKNLKSYVDYGKCILPVDSVCQKIHTGAWGCVIPSSPPCTTRPPYTPTPCPTTPTPCPTTTPPCTTRPPYTPTPCPTTPTPCPTTTPPCTTRPPYTPTPCPTTPTPCPTTTPPCTTRPPYTPTPCPTTPTPCPTTTPPYTTRPPYPTPKSYN